MDQMDILAMMDQMEKLQELCPGFSDGSLELSSNINGYNNGPHGSIYGPITGAPLPFMADVNAEPVMPPPAPPGASSSSSSSSLSTLSLGDQKQSSVAAMREMIFRIAAMQPINIDPVTVKPPKRRNVKISTDPQSVAARHRRERISERIRILQRLVPGGTKMDTASMLDEAIHYVKFLKTQVQSLERASADQTNAGIGISGPGAYLSVGRSYQSGAGQMFPPPTQLLS